MRSSVARNVARGAAAALLLAAVVDLCTRWAHSNATTAALAFLLLIQWLAATWGLRIAMATSIAAALCFNYFFLPPIGNWSIGDTQNWIAFGAFLATALISSNLADRLQAAHAASERRGQELAQLYDLGQRLLAPGSTAALLQELPLSIAGAFGCAGAAVYLLENSQLYTAGASLDLAAWPAGILQEAAAGGKVIPGPVQGSLLAPLSVGVRPLGALLLLRSPESPGGSAPALPLPETLEAVSSLVALSLERAAAIEKQVKAEAASGSDRLRATLLDAITHDLRTPLTSIKASVSALLSQDGLGATEKQELLTVIDEESDRLNRLIAQAVEMAELDAKAARLDREAWPLGELATEVLSAAQRRWPEREFQLLANQAGSDLALVDASLIRKVLLHLLENAAKYSLPGAPILLRIEAVGPALQVAVQDQGPGIAAGEQALVFNKFYRAPEHRYRVSGTGMGLPIARAIVEAHGGELTVESSAGRGSIFRFTVPRA